MILSTLLLLVITYFLWRVGKVVRALWILDTSTSHFITLPGYPLLRNYFEFSSYKTAIRNCLRAHKNYGGIIRIDLFYGMNVLQVTEVKLIEFVLSTTTILDKGYGYLFLGRWLGTGLLTSGGEKWKKSRKLITPAFHFQILEQYVEVFHAASDILVKKLKQEVGKGPFDVYPYVTLCTLDIICETAMGTKVNAQENATSEYVNCVREMGEIVVNRATNPLKIFETLYKFTRAYQREKYCLGVLHGYTSSVIKNRKDELLKSGPREEQEGRKPTKRLAFLDLLLQGGVLTDDEIRQEVDTIMFEGHDTTASGISFVLYCLATNPDVQNKVVEEMKGIFGDDNNRAATYQDLQEMKYLEMVVKETLRLYPSVPFYIREVNKEVKYHDILLPRKAQISIFAYGVHRDSANYPNPSKFDPERFTPENQMTRSPFSYLAFSAGPRNCVGQKFAMLEMKSGVSKILRNFEVLPVASFEPQLVPVPVLKSSNGVQIELKERI